jgi:hypothetical protein
MFSTRLRALGACAVALSGVTLFAKTAAADDTIYAVVTLTNDTTSCIAIPASGASTSNVWGTQGDTLRDFGGGGSGGFLVMPDGTPPRMLAPGQTMLWGTKSTGFMGGTGGSLSIPLPGETLSMSWSVPWSYYNGLGGYASGTPSENDGGGFPPPQPFHIQGGAQSCGPGGTAFGYNTCVFDFAITGGPPKGTPGAGTMTGGQCMAMPTQCPAGVQCNIATQSLVSQDGSTRLSIQGGQSFGAQSSWGGVLQLSGPNGASWSSRVYDVVAAQMGDDGNFVAYDSWGNVVWQSGTAGNPGAFLFVSPSQVSVDVPEQICTGFGRFRHCQTYDLAMWTATATSGVNQ